MARACIIHSPNAGAAVAPPPPDVKSLDCLRRRAEGFPLRFRHREFLLPSVNRLHRIAEYAQPCTGRVQPHHQAVLMRT